MAAARGSLKDLEALCTMAHEKPESTSTLFLPAFYANLKPEAVPDSDYPLAAFPLVQPAYIAMRGLALVRGAPVEAFPDLWRGIWAYMELITKLSNLLSAHLDEIWSKTMTVIGTLHRRDKTAARLIEAQPGFRTHIAATWKYLVQAQDYDKALRSSGLDEICHFLTEAMDINNPGHIDDLVEGAGGALGDLASLIVQFVGLLDADTWNQSLIYLKHIFAFVDLVAETRNTFRASLLSRKMVRTVTTLLCDFCKAGRPLEALDNSRVEQAFRMVIELLTIHGGHKFMTEAISAGLLRVIVSCAIYSEHISAEYLRVALNIMTDCSVYRSFLSHIRSALDTVAPLVASEAFKTSPIFVEWGQFMDLVNKRLVVLKYHESGYISAKACDNVHVSESAQRYGR
ncbi:hypothetical protein C8R44DRAFT_725984 [Mycena epipterygia]|nr:hypothetical protein C8R44DRAFT_725984 [Mycena epipterygia]